MRGTLVGLALGAVFIGALVFALLDQMGASCEVCMNYHGRSICEEVVADDRDLAVMQATSTACAQLSSGVTDGMRYNRTPPVSVRCSE